MELVTSHTCGVRHVSNIIYKHNVSGFLYIPNIFLSPAGKSTFPQQKDMEINCLLEFHNSIPFLNFSKFSPTTNWTVGRPQSKTTFSSSQLVPVDWSVFSDKLAMSTTACSNTMKQEERRVASVITSVISRPSRAILTSCMVT